MIRSRTGNWALTVFGGALMLYALVSLGVLIRDEGARFFRSVPEIVWSIIILALGVWCAAGGWRNLRRAAPESERSIQVSTYRYAKWDLSVLGVTGLAALATHFLGLRVAFVVCYYTFLLAFLGIWVILITHFLIRHRY